MWEEEWFTRDAKYHNDLMITVVQDSNEVDMDTAIFIADDGYFNVSTIVQGDNIGLATMNLSLSSFSADLIVNSIILIVAGALVGASGIILTLLMCAAMNRTLLDVLKGGFGGTAINNEYDKDPISTSPEDVAIQLSYAESVVIVPGYGMAVAQAQAAVKELTNTLKDKNIEVKFAIHPVAGRMPGHMNVLLAEVDIDYEDMFTLEDINSAFASTDVVIVLGANDVVNPLARTDEDSPIYGMPILDVDLAKQVIVLKRSMSPGYAGIANPLFINDNAKMLFADAKEGLENIIKSFELV